MKKMKHKTQRTTVNDGKTRQRVSTVQGQAQYTRTQNRRLLCVWSLDCLQSGNKTLILYGHLGL